MTLPLYLVLCIPRLNLFKPTIASYRTTPYGMVSIDTYKPRVALTINVIATRREYKTPKNHIHYYTRYASLYGYQFVQAYCLSFNIAWPALDHYLTIMVNT